jgi:hypothetical protein
MASTRTASPSYLYEPHSENLAASARHMLCSCHHDLLLGRPRRSLCCLSIARSRTHVRQLLAGLAKPKGLRNASALPRTRVLAMAGDHHGDASFRPPQTARGRGRPTTNYASLRDMHRTHRRKERAPGAANGVHLIGAAAHQSAAVSRVFLDFPTTSRGMERLKTSVVTSQSSSRAWMALRPIRAPSPPPRRPCRRRHACAGHWRPRAIVLASP